MYKASTALGAGQIFGASSVITCNKPRSTAALLSVSISDIIIISNDVAWCVGGETGRGFLCMYTHHEVFCQVLFTRKFAERFGTLSKIAWPSRLFCKFDERCFTVTKTVATSHMRRKPGGTGGADQKENRTPFHRERETLPPLSFFLSLTSSWL